MSFELLSGFVSAVGTQFRGVRIATIPYHRTTLSLNSCLFNSAFLSLCGQFLSSVKVEDAL